MDDDTDVAISETVASDSDTSAVDDLVMVHPGLTDVEALSEREHPKRWDLSAYAYFVLKCLAGRKEGGSILSQISQADSTSKTNNSLTVRVCSTAAVPVWLNQQSRTLPIPVQIIWQTQKIDVETLDWEVFVQSGPTERAAYDLPFPNFAGQPEMAMQVSVSVTEYPSICDLTLQKELAFRSAYDNHIMTWMAVQQTRDTARKRRVMLDRWDRVK